MGIPCIPHAIGTDPPAGPLMTAHAVTASANWGGYTGSREETISQANEFCDKSGQTAAIESFEDKPGVSPKGEQTSTLNFRCAARPVLKLR